MSPTRRKALVPRLEEYFLQGKWATDVARKLEGLAAKSKIPGVSATIIRKGKIAGSCHVGKASAMTGEAVTATTRFEAASLSKTVNALGVMRLFAEGKLDLDAPVNTLLTRWQLQGPHADKVTTRHLLSHTGSTTVHGFPGYAAGQPLPALTSILKGGKPCNTTEVVNDGRPGRRFRYSGGGTTVIQLLVEEITGQVYAKYMQASVLVPLQMTNSTYALIKNSKTPYLASSHNEDGVEIKGRFHRYPESAAAGLWTTSEDFARAVMAILVSWRGEDGAFLPKKLARQMFASRHGGAGLGIFVADLGTFNHHGSNYGFRCHFEASAAKGNGYVIMTNGENGDKLIRQAGKLLSA